MSNNLTSNKNVTKTKLTNSNQHHYYGYMFDFRYLIHHKKHGFEYFGKHQSRDASQMYRDFTDCLEKISKLDPLEFMLLRKNKGMESISFTSFPKQSQKILSNNEIVTNDSKLFIIRFGPQQHYRIICVPDPEESQLLHIICFDFDFSRKLQ